MGRHPYRTRNTGDETEHIMTLCDCQALAARDYRHLSGGEQQRVSIARAVAKKPKILLCDEPTGALDYQTGKQVLQILQDMSRKEGATVIIVTHNGALAPIADRVIHMRDAMSSRKTLRLWNTRRLP